MFKFLRSTAFAALAVVGLSAPAFAVEAPAIGLGQAWPNAPDVSSSPRWHVYVFVRDGVRFVQFNDINGNVRGAFATASGQFLVLPMGRDAQRIATPQQAIASTVDVAPQAYPETIYRDATLELTAVPLSDGTMMFNAISPCDDPEQCSTHLN